MLGHKFGSVMSHDSIDRLTKAVGRALPGAPRRGASDEDKQKWARHVAAVAERIATTVRRIASAPPPIHITSAQASEEAAELRDAVANLQRLLADSKIMDSVPLIACLVNGRAAVDEDGLARMCATLPLLRSDLEAVLAATSGAADAAQIELSGAGRAPGPARRIASAVLSMLHAHGANISSSDSSTAVEVVSIALDLVGEQASARRQVADWLKRHPATK